MEILPVISILIEVAVVLVGLAIALKRKKVYGWFIALSYALYTVYDINYFAFLNLEKTVAEVILLVGAAATLVAVWMVYKKK